MKKTLLIVDNEKDLILGLKRSIGIETDYEIITAENGVEAFSVISQNPVDVVLTDINMPEMDGMALLKAIANFDPSITTIVMTAYGTIDIAIEALKEGAYDFVQKPFELSALIRLVIKGMERGRLLRENRRLLRKIRDKVPFQNMVGQSTPLQKVFNAITMLAKSDVTVLITGETGTGKDLAALAVHDASSRRSKEMVTVNCPALPEGLLESELFGHKKGAFTGAYEDKKGLFDQADGGTIFLDEIGDLPASLQTKLLRVLQNRELKPIGADKSHQIDVRVIAATNQDLNQKIEKGIFRADLFYRLNVASLIMPSLRELTEDIPLFIDHFLNKAACQLKADPKLMAPEVIEYFTKRDWPGNIRELENTIQGLCSVTEGSVIHLKDIPEIQVSDTVTISKNQFSIPYKELKESVIEKFTKTYIANLLEHTKGNITMSAKLSGITRQSLQKIINRYAIDAYRYRE